MIRQRRQRKALFKFFLTCRWAGNGFALRHCRCPSLMPVSQIIVESPPKKRSEVKVSFLMSFHSTNIEIK